MSQSDDLIRRLMDYCLQKPNVEEAIDSEDDEPAFAIHGGDLDEFAHFYLDEDPPVLMLRCSDSERQRLEQASKSVVVSERMCWETSGWEWTDVQLNGSLPESTLISLLDLSHKLASDSCELDDDDADPTNTKEIDVSRVKEACKTVASSIVQAMKKCALSAPLFAVSLILDDDLEFVMLMSTSKDDFESHGWEVHVWKDSGEVNVEPFADAIGDADLDRSSFKKPATLEIAAYWLAGFVRSMQLAKANGAFGPLDDAPYLFCTITDNSEDLWFGHLSAHAISDAETFQRFSSDVAKEKGCRKKDGPLTYGDAKLQQAYRTALESLSESD